MAALTQDRITRTRDQTGMWEQRIAIKTSARMYRGAIVNRINTTGRALDATAATGRRIAGMCTDFRFGTVNTGLGNTGGTEYAVVEGGMLALYDVKTAIRTNSVLGLNVFVSDDHTVGGTAVGTAAARIVAGRLVEFEASDKSTGWVHLAVFGPTNVAI